MANKNSVYKKRADGSFQFWGYLPTEDVVGASEYTEKIADIITQLGGKANAFGVVGDGLSFNNNTITIDTDVMATREWVKAQGYSSDQIVSQQIEDVQHDVDSLSTRVSSTEASINNLNTAVSNRYTKGETVDNSYAVSIPRVNSADLSAFPAQNKVNFNEIGNGEWIGGLGYQWWHIMTMQGEDTGYFTQIGVMMAFGDTPQLAFRNKSGEDSWAVAISNRTIGSQHVDYANSAGYATSAGNAAECSSTTLLKAEGTNLGAKIQSQYTTGSGNGNVTYHQATWYVVGNDGETYNLGHMVTTDNFKSKLTEALKTTTVEYCTRSDFSSTLDSGNYTSSSLSLAYDSNDTTGLTYQSWPKLVIESNTGFGVFRGGVDGKGAFQIACGVDGHSLFYRYVKDNASPYGWVRLLTKANLSVVDNLTNTSAEAVLSANQGRILNNKFSSYQPLLDSGTGATMQWLSFKKGGSYSISGIWCKKVEMTVEGSVGNQASVYFTVDTYYQSTFSNGTWYFVAMPSSGGYINTLSWGLETNSSNTGGTLYTLRVYSGAKTTYKFNIIGIRLF